MRILSAPFIVGMRALLQVFEAFRYEASFKILTSPPALRGRAAPGAGCPLEEDYCKERSFLFDTAYPPAGTPDLAERRSRVESTGKLNDYAAYDGRPGPPENTRSGFFGVVLEGKAFGAS